MFFFCFCCYHGEATRDDLEIVAFFGAVDILGEGGEEGGHVIGDVHAILAGLQYADGSIGTVRSESAQPRLQNDVCVVVGGFCWLDRFGFRDGKLNRTGLLPRPGSRSRRPELAVRHARRRCCHKKEREFEGVF